MSRWLFGNILARDRQTQRQDASAGVCKACAEKDIVIREQEATILKLKKQVASLNGESSKRSTAHQPSSKDDFKGSTEDSKKPKNGGAKKGHQGRTRKPPEPDAADSITCELPPLDICNHCSGPMSAPRLSYFRRVLDISKQALHDICYKVPVSTCLCCGKSSSAKTTALPRCLLGNRLLATIAVAHYLRGISLGTIKSMYGLDLSDGVIHSSLDRLAKICDKASDNLIKDYRNDDVRHADETGWRTDGKSGYAWLFCSLRTAIMVFGVSRASLTPRSVFGEEKLHGTLVVDRYAGYNRLPVSLQYCYAHLLRDVEELGKNVHTGDFCSSLAEELAKAMHLQGEKKLSDEEYYERANKISSNILGLLTRPEGDPGVRALQSTLVDEADRLFVWARDRKVPATNNYAERTIRTIVCARKISFGSQSERGAWRRSKITSVLMTANLRNRGDPVDWLTSALDEVAKNPKINIYDLLPT